MATIRVVFENCEPERVTRFDPVEAPSQDAGRPGSILNVLPGHGVHLEHASGDNCACTTRHVIVNRGFEKLSGASEQEADLLNKAPGLPVTSRLGCQPVVEDALAELVVPVPRYMINQISERNHAVS